MTRQRQAKQPLRCQPNAFPSSWSITFPSNMSFHQHPHHISTSHQASSIHSNKKKLARSGGIWWASIYAEKGQPYHLSSIPISTSSCGPRQSNLSYNMPIHHDKIFTSHIVLSIPEGSLNSSITFLNSCWGLEFCPPLTTRFANIFCSTGLSLILFIRRINGIVNCSPLSICKIFCLFGLSVLDGLEFPTL